MANRRKSPTGTFEMYVWQGKWVMDLRFDLNEELQRRIGNKLLVSKLQRLGVGQSVSVTTPYSRIKYVRVK